MTPEQKEKLLQAFYVFSRLSPVTEQNVPPQLSKAIGEDIPSFVQEFIYNIGVSGLKPENVGSMEKYLWLIHDLVEWIYGIAEFPHVETKQINGKLVYSFE